MRHRLFKGQVNTKNCFLTSDRSSEMMKVFKRKYIKILNIYWVIEDSILALLLFFREFVMSQPQKKKRQSKLKPIYWNLVNIQNFYALPFGNLHHFRWSIWCEKYWKTFFRVDLSLEKYLKRTNCRAQKMWRKSRKSFLE